MRGRGRAAAPVRIRARHGGRWSSLTDLTARSPSSAMNAGYISVPPAVAEMVPLAQIEGSPSCQPYLCVPAPRRPQEVNP